MVSIPGPTNPMHKLYNNLTVLFECWSHSIEGHPNLATQVKSEASGNKKRKRKCPCVSSDANRQSHIHPMLSRYAASVYWSYWYLPSSIWFCLRRCPTNSAAVSGSAGPGDYHSSMTDHPLYSGWSI